MGFWYGVPELGLTIMAVVDGVKHEVLEMPTERRVLHSDVHPRHIYTRNLLHVRELQQ